MSLLLFRRTARSAIPLVFARWSVAVRWFHDNSSQHLPNHNKLNVSITWVFSGTVSANFRKFFSVSCEVLVWHGFHWVARTCATTGYRWLFRDSRLSLRILCSAVVKSPYFSDRRIDLFRFLWKYAWTLCFRYCVSTFEASPSESEITLSEECASTRASRSSRFSVKGCHQTGMPCVGSSLFVSSAGSRFPVACLSWSVSIGFPHACLSLRVVTGSDHGPNFLEQLDWSWWQSWYKEKNWVVHCASNCLPIFGPSWSFAVFHSHEYPRFEQSW